MKLAEIIVICFACVLALSVGVRAEYALSPDNPYASVVPRSVFGLNPPEIPAPADVSPPEKITPNGIMTIFGNRQVLFKVAGTARPGQPAKDQFYILSEGQ